MQQATRPAKRNSNAASRPEFASLLECARSLAPQLAASAQANELAGRVSSQTIDSLRQAGLLNLLKPKAFGGYEYGPAELVQIAFELGRADGSAGWCGSLAIYSHLMLSFFPQDVQQEVYASPNDITAVSYIPVNQCETREDGFLISGVWPYASNCDNAGWYIVAALAPANDGPPQLHWMLAPASQFEIDHTSWNVTGLRGTGSKSIKSKAPVFVPASHAIAFRDVVSGQVSGARIENNVMAKFRHPVVGPACLVAPVLGMAQGALDAFVANAKTRVRQAKPGLVNSVASNPMLQSRIGAASARIDAAKSLLVNSLAEAAAKVFAGKQLSQDERIAIRRNQGFAAHTAINVINDLHAHNGTAGVFADAPLQRYWRDANAAALHVSLDWEALSSMYGQNALGLEPVGSY